YGRAESGLPCHAVRGVWGLIALALLAAAMSVPANGQHGARCVTRDTPDLKFVDSNCDGIDGDAKNAVFVAPDGNDAAPGTMKRPLRTLSAAVRVAQARHRNVYAALGTYDERTGLQLVSGVSIFGGYSRSWKRSASMRTVVVGSPQAVVGIDVHG